MSQVHWKALVYECDLSLLILPLCNRALTCPVFFLLIQPVRCDCSHGLKRREYVRGLIHCSDLHPCVNKAHDSAINKNGHLSNRENEIKWGKKHSQGRNEIQPLNHCAVTLNHTGSLSTAAVIYCTASNTSV